MKRSAITVVCSLLTIALCVTTVQAQNSDTLFSSQDLQRVDLFLHSADWLKLKAEFQLNTYYPADMSWNGQTFRGAGIRSRGRGSRSSTKPGLRVDFDEFVTGGKFLGLKSLVLDNVTQDASGVHESVSMAFYARLGIPAPREVHTRLYVNNEYAGLYVIVESVDKDLLARVFGAIGEDTQNDGYLYEFKWMDDWKFGYLGDGLAEYKLRFEPTTHESKSDEELYRPIEALVRLANSTPTDRLSAELAPRLDVPAVIRFIAAQQFMAETDGFLGGFGVNNLYLYRLENSEAHTFIAWDADNTFYDPQYSITSGMNDNVLMRDFLDVPEYYAMFFAEMRRAVELAEADDWLNTETIRQVQRVDQAMKEDPWKPHPNSAYEGKAGDAISFVRARIAFVKCELERGPGNTTCRQ